METIISLSHGETGLNNVKNLRALHPDTQLVYISSLLSACAGGAVTRRLATIVSGGERATGSITLSGNPSNNDTVTIGGQEYTFKTTPAASRDIEIGEDVDETVRNLTAALSKGSFGSYFPTTPKNTMVVASFGDPGEVLLTSVFPGEIGNLIVVAKSGANIAVTGMAGGTDGEAV